VQIRSGASALHPLGVLRLTQTAAPLDVGLAKFGASAVTSVDPVTVAFVAADGVVTEAQELFATSQFFELSDDDRLSKPAYLLFGAGATLQGSGWQVSDPQVAGVVYEESLGLNDAGGGTNTFRPLDTTALGWTHLGASGRTSPGFVNPGAPKIGVRPTIYSVADAATGAVLSTGAASAIMASTRRSADTVAVMEFELEEIV
jgi:hypothetical protein